MSPTALQVLRTLRSSCCDVQGKWRLWCLCGVNPHRCSAPLEHEHPPPGERQRDMVGGDIYPHFSRVWLLPPSSPPTPVAHWRPCSSSLLGW